MKRIVGGFVVAFLILAVFLYAVGVEEVFGTFSRANVPVFFLGIVSAFIALSCWGWVWGQVLDVADHGISRIRIGLIFLGGMFANYVTPFGQVGGEPFIALVLSKHSGMDYDRSLAGVIAADVINLIPFFSFGVVGFAYFVSENSVTDALTTYALAFVIALVISVGLIVSVWRYRNVVEFLVVEVAAVGRVSFGRVSDSVGEKLAEEKIRGHVKEFFVMTDFIWENRRKMLPAVVFGHIGWFFTILPLYTSSLSLGYEIPLLLAMLIVPLSGIAGYLPLPGGLGGVEVTIAVLVSSLTPLGLATASAVVLLYRVCTYWFVLLVGGVSLTYLTFSVYDV